MERVGAFLFRWRGVVFPAVIVALAIAFPPQRAQTWVERGLLLLGLLVVCAGQALRALTIGWDYIERGGDRGRVAASRLVTTGMYAHCRNPMYLGNVLLVAGFLLAFGRAEAALPGMVFCVAAYSAIIRREEAFLRGRFPEEFVAYCARVPRWRLNVSAVLHALRAKPADTKAILLREYSTLSVTTVCATVLAAWRLHGKEWEPFEFTLVSAIAGIALGFYLTMRFLKRRRILYAPR
ncbi:MAG: isoprenylcysteine carboxylmethyltransferase family protein [Steroidobacteraceae bacterium]|nr:isoprenylcysteine carboxylmethyltransferase family protein [Steroidobacteraceae bacterium]